MYLLYVYLLYFLLCIGHCPSGDDPYTSDVDETDCEGVITTNYAGDNSTGLIGKSGNLCHVECSNRGVCDHDLGVCSCFDGYSGVACQDFY